ncbi:MAG: type II toxin-antitoxin system VapC family toxin [Pseudomonadota bacterium]
MIYLDTSVIVKLYFRETFSREAAAWLRATNEAIPLTLFHELEFLNAIALKRFRDEISEDDAARVRELMEKHKTTGIYFRPQVEWTDVFNRAIELSVRHSKAFGSRSLDILHVAVALSTEARRFITLDERQSGLAASAGLDVRFL